MVIKSLNFFIFLLLTLLARAQTDLKVEPPFWWSGMKLNEIQLVVYGDNISYLQPQISNNNIQIKDITKTGNKNYIFLDISIHKNAREGFEIEFLDETGKTGHTYFFELKSREGGSGEREGVNSSDVIYLLMPDRFANGYPKNDSYPDMKEKVCRDSSSGRHGGDIKGITDHLGYIHDMGFTAIWLNPILENDMYSYTYHGYAITDFYNVDRRLGSNEEYLKLVEKSHALGLKVVKDMVFNHAGTQNYLVKDPPMKNWVHNWPEYTSSNYRTEVISAPYTSDYDYRKMNNGWFDTTMADLDQTNPLVIKYLIQNSIWWIEYAGIDAIRMDTYPYPDKYAMSEWAKTVMEEYPVFTIIGEAWHQDPVHVSYWQKDACHTNGYNSHINSVFDFPLFLAVNKALTEVEGWETGLERLYTALSKDRVYPNPNYLVVFPDNHDGERLAEVIGDDINKYKLAMAFYLTIRGIPQIYYGTEIMMGSKPYKDHGSLRREFPGGWPDSKKNAFTGEGLSGKEIEAQLFMRKLLNWRKNETAVHTGKLKHFIPENGVYVYSRYTDNEQFVIILNKNETITDLNLERYKELFSGYSKATDIISGNGYPVRGKITLKPMAPLILELK